MVALLVVTAVLNIWLLGGNEDPEAVDTMSFFSSFRLERETYRTQEMLYLDGIINNDSAEFATARAAAMEQKLKLIELMEKEWRLEEALKTRGYEDAVVSIGTDSDNINVIVMCDELTLNDRIIIYVTVKGELGSADLVKIFNL